MIGAVFRKSWKVLKTVSIVSRGKLSENKETRCKEVSQQLAETRCLGLSWANSKVMRPVMGTCQATPGPLG